MKPLIVLAHGAGAGQSHPFMQAWAAHLRTFAHVVPFEYVYMQRPGRRPPDRLPKLLVRHREVVDEAVAAHPGAPLVLVGKSMGSRVGCHLANALGGTVRGLVCLGYPLKGRTSLRDEVLRELTAPILFVQGTRDPLCPLDLLAEVRPTMQAPSELHVVDGGDHSLMLRKRDLKAAGTTQDAVDAVTMQAVRDWVTALIGPDTRSRMRPPGDPEAG